MAQLGETIAHSIYYWGKFSC